MHVGNHAGAHGADEGAGDQWYVSTSEPYDKAGGYAVQGLASRFVEGIDGSSSNVVGLPISNVYELLKELGCDTLGITKAQE